MTHNDDIFVGDNDHGDALPEPKCESCGVPWIKHSGIMGTCADNKSLREDLQAMLEAHDEMMVLIEQLYTQRDEARREVCVLLHTDENGCVRVGKPSEAAVRGWDCFETPKEKDPVEVRQRWEAYRLRKEQEEYSVCEYGHKEETP